MCDSQSMRRGVVRWALCAGLALLCAAGCSSTGVLSQDHVRFEHIVEAVDALRAAYEHRDIDAFRALRVPLREPDRLEREVRRDFAAYADIALTVTIERVHIHDEHVTVNVRWEGEWRRAPDDPLVTGRGHCVLVWSGRDAPALASAEGNLPFGAADRGGVTLPGQ